MRRCARVVLPPLIAAALVLAITEVPYAAGRSAAPPGQRFDGLIAYSGEIHSYLSFVRQAAEGRWLFENRYAPESHAPVYFNLEWLVVGWAMRLFGDAAALVVWRSLGALLLASGFWALAATSLRRGDRLPALAVFCLGGGLGWLGLAAHHLGLLGATSPELYALFHIDQYWGGQPFVQVLHNPHFSLPHGLVLFALALLVVAERTARTSAYALAGLVALAACLCRPYDVSAFFVLLPALHLSSGNVGDLRRGAQRLLTLVVLSPALLPVAVLMWHPSFRPWSTQGVIPGLPLIGYVMLLGLPAVGFVARIARDRLALLARPEERVVVLWGLVVLLLSSANHFTQILGYSAQLVITSMGPLVLLSIPLVPGSRARPRSGPRCPWTALAVLVVSLPSSVLVLDQRRREAVSDPSLFVTSGEAVAWEWLAREVRPTDLVLTTAPSGNRLPRHIGAHVLPGQWALTPEAAQRFAEAEAFFSGGLGPVEAAAYLRRWGVDWLWVGPREKAMGGWGSAHFAPGCETRYKQLGVRIYRCMEAGLSTVDAGRRPR